MSYFRLLAFLCLWVTVAPAQQTPPVKPPTQTPPPAKPPAQPAPPMKPGAETKPASPAPPAPPKADPKADATLKQALEQLDAGKVGWMQVTVWQQFDSPGLSLKVDGSYLSGPRQQLRLEVRLHTGAIEGESKTVSDGTTVWNETRAGSKTDEVMKWDLRKVQDALNSPGTPPQLREEFYRSQAFTGLSPLLMNLRKQMTFTKQESARWNGQEVLKLTAEWSPEVSRSLVGSSGQWPPYIPRSCRLYLGKVEGNVLWPYRLEWWGPTAPKGEDRQLVQMEFRDPHLTKPDAKPPGAFAGAFRFDAGTLEVTDRTKDMLDQITQARNRAASAPAGPGPSRP
jgi:hypothetical protein